MIAALPGKKWPRDIVTIGHPALITPCEDIEDINSDVMALTLEMIEAMDQARGVGLAANQLGVNINMFVYRWKDDPKVVINPIVLGVSDEMYEDEEGCLSIPGFFADVERPNKVWIGYKDLHGTYKETEMRDFGAKLFLHEIDHLSGDLFVKRLTSAQKRAYTQHLIDFPN